MTNAEQFKKTFGIYAEEFWSYTEKQMLDWINTDVPDINIGGMISRQAAIDAKQEFRNPNVVRDTEARTAYDRTYANGWNDCNSAWINAIKALPSAQPEIIRCKDCKYITEHYDTDGNAPYWTCSEWDSGTDYDGFCHYAERRTDETD